MIPAETMLAASAAYLAIGGFVAFGFVALGVRRATGQAATWGARLIMLPGAMLLWPVVWQRWRRS
jgi:hypothetical protein